MPTQSRNRIALLLFVLPLFVSPCFAQTSVTIETISGTTVSGDLKNIDTDGTLVGAGLEGVNIQQVLSIATDRKSTLTPAKTVQLKLVDGGQLFVNSPTIDGETIKFAPTSTKLSSISIQSVRAIVFDDSDLIREALAKPATNEDTIIVENKKGLSRVAGVLESLDDQELVLNFNGKSRPINRQKRKILAIVIADLGLEPPQGMITTLSLTDGSTLRGALTGIDESSISMLLTGKQVIQVPHEHFVRLDIDSDSIAYLSAMEPTEVRQQAQFTVERQWQRNLSVEGNPIRLLVSASDSKESTQIQKFENGIGTSSFSRIVFENTNEFSRFRTTAGIDAETSGRGDCVMRVEGDGITLWSQRIRGSDPAVEVDVDIKGISQVALIVDTGEQFDLADHADWARARFVKTE